MELKNSVYVPSLITLKLTQAFYQLVMVLLKYVMSAASLTF